MLFLVLAESLQYELIGIGSSGTGEVADVAGGAVPEGGRCGRVSGYERLDIGSGGFGGKVQDGTVAKAIAAAVTKVFPEPAKSSFSRDGELQTLRADPWSETVFGRQSAETGA